MNKFEQEYIKIINEWNFNILLEANLKSLIPNIQQNLIGNKSYNDLNDKEKQNLQNNINTKLSEIEQEVNKITDNKQYQSWIYNILKNNEVKLTELKFISNALSDFIKLSKHPDLKPQQKNIQNYNSLKALQEFIDSFKEEHNLSSNIYKNLKKVYSNKEFTVYFINKDQYQECNKLFGGTEYFNTGWCIAKNENHFNNYIQKYKDKYNGYFVFIKDNKPFALLHYGSHQFKDESDKILTLNNDNLIDCLQHINNNPKEYYDTENDDLFYYSKLLFLKNHPNPCKEDWIAFEIGGEYDPKTKTIDCKGQDIKFKYEWLDGNGTFDFNFINTSNSWRGIFSNCTSLKKLPENFTIPNNVITCEDMFQGCKNLKELPNNFTIPDSVTECHFMFSGCFNLKELPNNFKMSNNIINCSYMFYNCKNLIELPNNFTIPNNVKSCEGMFEDCRKLKKLPIDFSIPNGVINCGQLVNKCRSLRKLPNNFTIPNSVKNCDMMFMECDKLQELPDNFAIPKQAYSNNIFLSTPISEKDGDEHGLSYKR